MADSSLPDRRRTPMKFDYSQITQALIEEARAKEAELPLRNEQCRSLFFCHNRPTGKVLLLFHGFTAAPYQFARIAHALFQDGYNVLVPLLPGHGLAGRWNAQNPPPLPTSQGDYQDFAVRWLKRSRVLGRQLIVGGIGSGGTLATWLSLAYPSQIDRSLLLAPYWPDSQGTIDLFAQAQQQYYRWITPRKAIPLPCYSGFSQRSLELFFELGETVLSQASQGQSPPALLVTSESDRAIGNSLGQPFLERLHRCQSSIWHLKFNRVLDLAHATMMQLEENNYETQLIKLVKHFTRLDLEQAA
ncbi:alpha/beta hydrolase [Prochlorothrix hollandica]|uniref:alpha/beta hydrolase n=1 Tax=Prochlorothrix hollandica TaxID=1223 RepID=UPI00334215C0